MHLCPHSGPGSAEDIASNFLSGLNSAKINGTMGSGQYRRQKPGDTKGGSVAGATKLYRSKINFIGLE